MDDAKYDEIKFELFEDAEPEPNNIMERESTIIDIVDRHRDLLHWTETSIESHERINLLLKILRDNYGINLIDVSLKLENEEHSDKIETVNDTDDSEGPQEYYLYEEDSDENDLQQPGEASCQSFTIVSDDEMNEYFIDEPAPKKCPSLQNGQLNDVSLQPNSKICLNNINMETNSTHNNTNPLLEAIEIVIDSTLPDSSPKGLSCESYSMEEVADDDITVVFPLECEYDALNLEKNLREDYVRTKITSFLQALYQRSNNELSLFLRKVASDSFYNEHNWLGRGNRKSISRYTLFSTIIPEVCSFDNVDQKKVECVVNGIIHGITVKKLKTKN